MEENPDRLWLLEGEGEDENSLAFIFVLPFFYIKFVTLQ